MNGTVLKIRALFAGDHTADLYPANDQVTINHHKTLDQLADDICRADCDVIRAQTLLTEAKEAMEQAIGDRERAHQAFIRRCSEKFSLEIPLPGEAKPS